MSPKPKRPSRATPTTVKPKRRITSLNPLVRAKALELAKGDVRRIEIVGRDEAIVH